MAVKPSIPLSTLIARLPSAQVQGDPERLVRGLTHDSRTVQPGDLFVCLKGAAYDGHRFAEDALTKGAVALLVKRGGLEAAGIQPPADACIIAVEDTRRTLPLLACAYYG